jgi:hypothetical protein
MKKLLFTLILLVIGMAACTPARPSLKNDLLGSWQNSQGFQIEFRSGGVGFIPGVQGKIPDTNFTYQITDEQHIRMDTLGQQITIEIHVNGDQLIWKDSIGEVQYSRVKK